MYICYLPHSPYEIIKVIQKEITDFTNDLRVVKFDMTKKEEIENARDIINLTSRRRWKWRKKCKLNGHFMKHHALISPKIYKFIKSDVNFTITQNNTPQNKSTLIFSLISRFGTGGSFIVECPICGETVCFSRFDIDSFSLSSTRQCPDCDSIIRISRHRNQPSIFRDLGITLPQHQGLIEIAVNEREIYSHGLEIFVFQ